MRRQISTIAVLGCLAITGSVLGALSGCAFNDSTVDEVSCTSDLDCPRRATCGVQGVCVPIDDVQQDSQGGDTSQTQDTTLEDTRADTASAETSVDSADDTPPDVVDDLEAIASDGVIDLTWTFPPNGDLGACWLLRVEGDAAPTTPDDGELVQGFEVAPPGADGNFQDTNVTNGTTYTYAIFCDDEAGNLQGAVGGGNSATVTPLAPAPPNPAGVTASDGDDASSTVMFDMPAEADECVVVRKLGAAPEDHTDGDQVYAATSAGPQEHTDTGLDNGETYYYAVFCRNDTTWNDGAGGDNVDTAVPGAGGAPWWDCGLAQRLPVAVTSGLTVSPGYAVKVTFDHAALVASGASPAGNDVFVVAWDGSAWTQVHRVLDPASQWNTADTAIWFPLLSGDPALEPNYYLYATGSAASSPLADESQIFHFADFFDRPDDPSVGNGWALNEESGDVALNGFGLAWVDGADADHRPIADHDFTAIGAGGVAWRFGFNWARNGVDPRYRVYMQLGDAASMEAAPDTTEYVATLGVAQSLVWAGPATGVSSHQGLGHEVAGTISETATVTGVADVEVLVTDVTTGVFDLRVDEQVIASNLARSRDVTRVDRVRFMTMDVDTTAFASSRFEYVVVRPFVRPEPMPEVGSLEEAPASCP